MMYVPPLCMCTQSLPGYFSPIHLQDPASTQPLQSQVLVQILAARNQQRSSQGAHTAGYCGCLGPSR